MAKEMSEAMLLRFFNGESTPRENEEMTAWMEESPAERQKILDSAYKLHVLSIMHTQVPAASAGHQNRQIPTHSNFMRYAVSIAAVLIVSIGAGFLFFSQRVSRMEQLTTKIEAPEGQHIRFTLNDGSVVDLNSGGSVSYPAVFTGGERRVRLAGEAMFDVAHDAQKPFVVETFSYEVRVLGTRFNVIANEARSEFSTALFEGRVAIDNISSGEHVVLEPNMMADLQGGRLVSSSIGSRDDYLWPSGIISVGGLPFDKLVERLEKTYDVRVVVAGKTMPEVGFTSLKVYRADGIEHVMNILQQDSNFTYHYDAAERTVTIK